MSLASPPPTTRSGITRHPRFRCFRSRRNIYLMLGLAAWIAWFTSSRSDQNFQAVKWYDELMEASPHAIALAHARHKSNLNSNRKNYDPELLRKITFEREDKLLLGDKDEVVTDHTNAKSNPTPPKPEPVQPGGTGKKETTKAPTEAPTEAPSYVTTTEDALDEEKSQTEAPTEDDDKAGRDGDKAVEGKIDPDLKVVGRNKNAALKRDTKKTLAVRATPATATKKTTKKTKKTAKAIKR